MTESFVSSIEIQDFPLWKKIDESRAALSFELEATARCPNDCRHCYINLPAGDARARRSELSLPEIERIAGEAVDLGVFWCLITGGEPLLRPDFAQIYLALKKKGLLLSVFTTACLINGEHIELFKRYPPRDIEVSVYGVTRETYERVTRKPGSFAAFMRGLDRLLEAGVRIRLKAMALRSNVRELPEMARFCRERTKDYFRFDPLLHLRLDGDPNRNKEIRSERLAPSEIAALERADPDRFGAMQRGCNELILPGARHTACDHLFHCGAGNGSFYVSHDGEFRLCSSLCHPDATYDLRKGSLAEAWKTMVPKVRDLRSHRKEYLETCRVCPMINLCLWCPAHAHLETGQLDGPVEYFCRVAHERARQLKHNESAETVRADE